MNDQRVSRAGPDDGHPAQRWPPVAEQRQPGSGIEQDDGPLGHLASQRAVGRRVEVPPGVQDRALRRPVRVEQAELDLLGEHPASGAVDDGFRQFAAPHLVGEPWTEADRVGQFDVDARR